MVTITQGLSDQIRYITKTTDSIKSDIKVLIQFQTQVETRESDRGQYEAKLASMQKEYLNNKRWRLGLFVTTILSMAGLLIVIFT